MGVNVEQPLDHFRAYPAYKRCSYEWLRQIPSHWTITRLKTIVSIELSNVDKKSLEGEIPVRLCNYTDVYYHDRITDSIEFMQATATQEQVRRFSLLRGDVLITKDSESPLDITVPALVDMDLPGVLCGYHLACIRPGPLCLGKYLFRVFSAIGPRDQFQLAANGITRFGLTSDAIRTGILPLPPVAEQQAISAFLDRETVKLDALVSKKERLVEVLQEKRTALIHRAVTQGLEPTIPKFESGYPWLGQIPSHWEVAALGVRYEIALGKMLDSSRISGRSLHPYLRNIDVQWDSINTVGLPEMDFLSSEQNRYRLRPNDLLVCEGGAVGRAALWHGAAEPCYYQKALHRLRPRTNHDEPRFLFYVFLHFASINAWQASGNPNTIDHLPADTLRRWHVAFPPLHEQREIAAFLDRQNVHIDTLITKVRHAIAWLKEYRSALISAAVTGKINVRGEVAAPQETVTS